MWSLLRKAILYYTRCDPLPGVPDNLEEASRDMREYSRIVEQHCYPPMCTFLLHIINCRFPDQEKAHGKICYNTEYWIEREVKGSKGVLHGRSKKEPALVMANTMLLEEGADRCRSAGNAVKSFDELIPEYRSQASIQDA